MRELGVTWFICRVVGDGSDNSPFRPSIVDFLDKYLEGATAPLSISTVYKPEMPPYKVCVVRVKGKIPSIPKRLVIKELKLADWVKLCEDRHWWHRWFDQPVCPVKKVSEKGDPVETRYMRSDSHTVNGLTAYKLLTTNTTTSTYKQISESGEYSPRWYTYVYKRASDGTTTFIASCYVRRTTDGEGLQSCTIDIPETSMAPTDAVQVRVRMLIYSVQTNVYFITEQLGAGKLDAATWTSYLYTYRDVMAPGTPFATTYARFYWGNSTYNSRIENFSWTEYVPPPVVRKVYGDGLTWIAT